MKENNNDFPIHEEVETFRNIPNDVFTLLCDFFYALKRKTVGYYPARFLSETLVSLDNHPGVPKNDTCVNFSVGEVNFSVIYTSYKIELSDYVSEIGDWGSDSYQRFNFRYEIDDYSEHEGNIDEFRSLLFDSLEEVKVTDISIGDEE